MDRAGKNNSCYRHGHASRGSWSGAYKSWVALRDRCNNPNHAQYNDYGGRGIKVGYASFDAFLADVGNRPEGCSIDRIDSDRDYVEGNCKWSTSKEQNSNRRNCIIYKGKTLKQVARDHNIPYGTLYHRVKAKGLSVEVALCQ